MKVISLKQPVVSSWSPRGDQLALGTLAGSIGTDFDTSSTLEIVELNQKNNGFNTIAKVEAEDRFHRICWSKDFIAGGLDNGAIHLWDAKNLSSISNGPLGKLEKHSSGPVKGIDFNNIQTQYLASGGVNGEVFIWNLSKDPSNPEVQTAGKTSAQQGDISCLQWNRKVWNILGSSSLDGTTLVWDVRAQKSVLNFANPGQKLPVQSICWTAEATRILTASGSDAQPVIQLWDLKNVMAPVSTFKGHKSGVWGLSWCPSDPDLILSAGKDKTICWNLKTGEIQSDIETSQWNFDVQWSTRPGLLSASSFDSFDIYSVADFSTPVTQSEYGFQENNSNQTKSRTNAPKWLKRPCGVAFGFGGQVVSFNSKQKEVKIRKVTADQEILDKASQLEELAKTIDLGQFCEDKINQAQGNEKISWEMIQLQLDPRKRKKILEYLGYDTKKVEEEVTKFNLSLGVKEGIINSKEEKKPAPKPTAKEEQKADTAPESDDKNNNTMFSGLQDDAPNEFDDLLKNEPNKSQTESVSEGESSESDTDEEEELLPNWTAPVQFEESGTNKHILSSLLVGNFELAIDTCIKSGRMAEAFLLASAAPHLWPRTQAAYFRQNDNSFTRILACIVKDQIRDLVENVDLKQWKAAVAILCTYTKKEDFILLSGVLGDRLLEADNAEGAALCYIASGNLDRAIKLWSKNNSLFEILEKITIFRRALKTDTQPVWNETVGQRFCQYAGLLAAQGQLAAALSSLAFLSEFANNKDVFSSPAYELFYRLYQASDIKLDQPPKSPFGNVLGPRDKMNRSSAPQTRPKGPETGLKYNTPPAPIRSPTSGHMMPPAPTIPTMKPTNPTPTNPTPSRQPARMPTPVYTPPPVKPTGTTTSMPPAPTIPAPLKPTNPPAPVRQPPPARTATTRPPVGPPTGFPVMPSGPSSISPTPFGPRGTTTVRNPKEEEVKKEPEPVVTSEKNNQLINRLEEAIAKLKETDRDRFSDLFSNLRQNKVSNDCADQLENWIEGILNDNKTNAEAALKALVTDHWNMVGSKPMTIMKKSTRAQFEN